MSLDSAAITPVASPSDIPTGDIQPEGVPVDIDPAIPVDAPNQSEAVQNVLNRLEDASSNIELEFDGQAPQSVRTISPVEDGPQAVFDIGSENVSPPTFDQAMHNFKAATNHAIEVTIISSAGSSMAGSMTKLMSGN